LKPKSLDPDDDPGEVPPGLTAGGGLKPNEEAMIGRVILVPPGLTAGGGLKLFHPPSHSLPEQFPPASPPGAD